MEEGLWSKTVDRIASLFIEKLHLVSVLCPGGSGFDFQTLELWRGSPIVGDVLSMCRS